MNYLKYKWRMKQRSFAQQGEDLLIENACNDLGIQTPTYLDIGAHHPIHGSNTYLFYLRGNRGVVVEPNPVMKKLHRKERPRDTFFSAGIGTGSLKYHMFDKDQLNTFSEEEAQEVLTTWKAKSLGVIDVPLYPINDMLECFADGVDILSVDAEGYDLEILKDINYEKYSPKSICVETLIYEHGVLKKRQDIIDFLLSKGYAVYADTHTNTIFIKSL